MIKYYIRVSTVEQKLDRQLIAYQDADITYIGVPSGKRARTTVRILEAYFRSLILLSF